MTPFFFAKYLIMSETFNLPQKSKVLLRSPQIASRVFGVNSPNNIMQSVPRVKFEFYVQFVLGPQAVAMIEKNAKLNNYDNDRGLSFKVKSVDKPKVTLQTEELNQYNKKVLIYKKVEYSEASVRLHDTVDNSALATWIDYFTFYFADSRLKSNDALNNPDPTAPYQQSPYDSTMNWDSGWGFQPLVDKDTHFFTGIIVYSLFANTYTAWEYVNPKITNIDFQNYDYSSSETDELNIQFKYEAIRYLAYAQPIANNSLGFMENFGFTTSDYINLSGNTPTGISSGYPRIFTNTLQPPQTNSPQTPAQSNNISNPSGNIPTLSQSLTTFYSAQYGNAGVAPGATLPTIVSNFSSLINPVSFGGVNGIQNPINSGGNTGIASVISTDSSSAGAQAANYIDTLF